MTKRERLELLIMKLALASGDSEQFQNVVKRFQEEANTIVEPGDIKAIAESEMIQGVLGVWEFSDEPEASTIMVTAKTMAQFHINDLLKDEGIDIMGND